MNRIIVRLERLAVFESLLILASSIIILATWHFDLLEIKQRLPDQQLSNPVTALCFAGLAAALLLKTKTRQEISRKIAAIVGLAVALTGAAVLSDTAFGISTGLDKWLYAEKLLLYGANGKPNYMAPNTALCFLFAGLSLFFYNRRRRGQFRYLSCGLALTFGWIAFISVLGHIYNAGEFYNIGSHIPMAFITAVSFLLLSLAILFARCGFGILRVFTEQFTGSKIIRWILPFALLVPSLLGLLRIRGEAAGLYSEEFGVVLMASMSVMIFVGLLWITSVYLHQASKALYYEIAAKARLNRQLQDLNKALEGRVKEKSRQLVTLAMIHQQELLKASFEGQEKERRQIGMDLHDNVNQMLATANLYLDMSKKSPERHEELIEVSKKQVLAAIRELRALSKALVSHDIEENDLLESIRELTEPIRLSRKIDFDLCIPPHVNAAIKGKTALALYRILQEQLNNIVKYASATRVEIALNEDAHGYTLLISDNGIGFDTTQRRPGIGLANIESRAALLGGSFSIMSAPQRGCTLRICFPKLST